MNQMVLKINLTQTLFLVKFHFSTSLMFLGSFDVLNISNSRSKMKTSESSNNVGPRPLSCPQCEMSFSKVSELGTHQMRYHHDTWAVIDLLEAGVSDKEAAQMYEKCIRNRGKKFGRGRKRALVDNSPTIEDPKKNRQICQLFSHLGALSSSEPVLMPKPEPKIEFEDQTFCVKIEKPMNGSWIVNEDVFHNNIPDEAADTGISDNNHDNQKLMDTFEMAAKDNEVCKATDSLRFSEDVNFEKKPSSPLLAKNSSPEPSEDEGEIIENKANSHKMVASEIFFASGQTFVDSNEKEMQRLAREIDEMLEQEMAGCAGSLDL